MDKEARDRVLPGFTRCEASVMSDSDETIWSSASGEEEDVSCDGVTDPSRTEFRSVEELEDSTGDERSIIPEAIETASGAEASISCTLIPNCRASSQSCCARACSASDEFSWRTSVRYLSSSRTEPDVESISMYRWLGRLASGRAWIGGIGRRFVQRERSGLLHGTSVDEMKAHNDRIHPFLGA